MVGFNIALITAYVFLALFANFLTPYSFDTYKSKNNVPFPRDAAPSIQHIFGTNAQSFDVFTRVIFGVRTALFTVIISILISLVIGTILAISGGYLNGILDRIISIFISTIFAIPSLVVAIILSIFFASITGSIMSIAVAIAISYIPQYYRAIHTLVLQIKEEPYILSSKIYGAKTFYIARTHILPNILSPIPAIAVMNAAEGISILAALGFLGLGIQPDKGAEWGYDIQRSIEGLNSGIWWPTIFPIIALVVLTSSLSILAISLTQE
jgi:peptide/nickel transport system permease protein